MYQAEVDQLKQLLDYDAEMGVFRWKVASGSRAAAGAVAGTKSARGDWGITCRGRCYKAHRLAWLFVHGRWPVHQIDHIDGNPLNNAISNLREATQQENAQNQKRFCTNTSGVTGVSWHKQRNRWCAYIWLNYKKISLGLFDTVQEAAAARSSAKALYHTFNPTQRVK